MHEGKLTLPVLHVLNATGDEEARSIALRVKSGVASADEIGCLVAFTKENGGIEYAERVMRDYREKAFALLPATADTAVRQSLEAYLNYVVKRQK